MKNLLWCALLFLFGIGYLLIQERTPSQKTSSFKTKYPQEYMQEVAVWAFTEEGMLKHHLSADSWAYLPEKQTSELSTPHLTIYKPDNTVWQIDAKYGHVQQPTLGSIEQVELSSEVILKRPASKNIMPVKLETDVLRYQPKKQYAETDKKIKLTKPDLMITGEGMRAYLDTNSVELLNNVKSNFVGAK